MYLDKENMFSDGQTVTATAVGTNVVDLGLGDIGPSDDVSLFVNAPVAFTGAGTLIVEMRTAEAVDAAGVMQNPVTIATFPISNASLKAGGKLVAARLMHGFQRYAGINYAVSGTITAGTITAGLVYDTQANAFIPR